MGDRTTKDGGPVPVTRDPETEALIDRCVQLHVSLSRSEDFLNTHQQAIADLYVAAKLPLPFPEDRRTEWHDTHRQISLAKETLLALGLTEDEITARLAARYDECAYPTDPRYAHRTPMLAKLAGKAYDAMSRFFGRFGWKWRERPKGGQRDLYH